MAERCPPRQCFADEGRAYDQGSPSTSPMSERLDDAFSAIEELWHAATERSERAEWLCNYVLEWAAARGLCFDCERATRDLRDSERREPRPAALWYQERVVARGEELRELRESLERAYEGERLATKWARRERRRAEAAETKCTLLMAQIRRQKERAERHG